MMLFRKVDAVPPPFWEPVTAHEAEALSRAYVEKKILAWVTCPNGHMCALVSPPHSVDAHGFATPSLDCPVKDCGFHQLVELIGWTP